MLVLSGSGGGIPPASGYAGGLASRGYAVLALAYFGAEGLPRSPENIPLEYFGTALDWMLAQPSIDTARIGILGASRGAELALLLGSIFPQILLVSGHDGGVWRSTDMGNAIMERLRRHQFAHASRHLVYDGAGHAIGRPYTPTTDLDNVRHPLTGRLMHLGGTPEGTAHAREDAWRQVLTFLTEQLR